MLFDQIQVLIANLGFPIFVCVILLFQYKHSLEKLTKSLRELTDTLHELRDTIISEARLRAVIKEELQTFQTNCKRSKKENENI